MNVCGKSEETILFKAWIYLMVSAGFKMLWEISRFPMGWIKFLSFLLCFSESIKPQEFICLLHLFCVFAVGNIQFSVTCMSAKQLLMNSSWSVLTYNNVIGLHCGPKFHLCFCSSLSKGHIYLQKNTIRPWYEGKGPITCIVQEYILDESEG